MAKTFFVALAFLCAAHAQTNENTIAEFSRQQREANWPALFEKVGAEFNVPADVLAGISLVQTRWFHFTAPTNQSGACTGMPQPFGIMGLWDDDTNGHNLSDAAKLLGQDAEELKKDPLQNCRGAAALLKKLFQENPLPEGTAAGDIESWRNAIAKFSGLPEAAAQGHALGIFEAINQGDHELGIDWPAHPVNLESMREAVKKISDAASLTRKNTAVAEISNEPDAPPNPHRPTSAQIKKFRALQAAPRKHSPVEIEEFNWTVPVVTSTVAFFLLAYLLLRRRASHRTK